MSEARELTGWYVNGSETTTKIWVQDSNKRRVCTVNYAPNDSDVAALIAAAPELYAYAICENARTGSEDIAETVLMDHGWNPAVCTAQCFCDELRRAALAKARGRG